MPFTTKPVIETPYEVPELASSQKSTSMTVKSMKLGTTIFLERPYPPTNGSRFTT